MTEKKPIELTLGQIACADETGAPLFMTALRKLRRQPLGKEAYAVGKSIRMIEQEYADYVEAYQAIIHKYGDEVSPGNWKVEGEKLRLANLDIADLKAEPFTIYLDHQIKLPDLGGIAEQLNVLSGELMRAAAAKPDEALATAQIITGVVREWWSMVLTPEDAMQLEPLITE